MSGNNIKAGSKAPEFSLYDTEKKKISLSEQSGKNILLVFFPQAFTSVCTAELCSLRDNISIYNQVNALVFGISVDSLFTLAKFKEEQKFNFPLLSDFNKETSVAYGALFENFAFDMRGVSKRAAFVIDKEGIVQYAEVLEKPADLPDFNAIVSILQKLN